MKTRGKFRLDKVTRHAQMRGETFTFYAVCNDGTPENERFHKYTPSGQVEIRIDNPTVQENFKSLIGKEFYLDFTPVEG